jgi:hypothetical protein
MAWRGAAWQGMARQGIRRGSARQGVARQGVARHGKARNKDRGAANPRNFQPKTNMNLITGIPTKPDVDKLMDASVDLNAGDVLKYSIIEQLIGQSRKTNRALSIITAFRRRIYIERNILLTAAKNEGLRCANPVERVEVACKGVVQGRKKIMRAASVASTTAEAGLDSEQRKTRTHILNMPARLKLAQMTAPKSFMELTE